MTEFDFVLSFLRARIAFQNSSVGSGSLTGATLTLAGHNMQENDWLTFVGLPDNENQAFFVDSITDANTLEIDYNTGLVGQAVNVYKCGLAFFQESEPEDPPAEFVLVTVMADKLRFYKNRNDFTVHLYYRSSGKDELLTLQQKLVDALKEIFEYDLARAGSLLKTALLQNDAGPYYLGEEKRGSFSGSMRYKLITEGY